MNMRNYSEGSPQLRMTYPGFVFRSLANEGHKLPSLLANTGLNEDVLADPDFQTGFPALRQFFLNAIELTGDRHLGVRLARKFEANFIGLPAYAAMNAARFEDALTVLNRFFFLAFPAIDFTVHDQETEVERGEFAIRLHPKFPLLDISYFASASALIALEGLCKTILRIPDLPLRGELSIAKPEGWADIEEQIGFPIRFEAPHIRLFLRKDLLSKTLPGADPLNHRRLISLCEAVAEREMGAKSPVGQVTAFLQEGQNLSLSISQVATALGFSERGLRRHLERSGTTFRTLTNEIRERRARAMLANAATPIKTIADDLGFDSPSNFARSFKQWTGMSPQAFRLGQTGIGNSGQK
jgi:AraC-like DNA-binding protein